MVGRLVMWVAGSLPEEMESLMRWRDSIVGVAVAAILVAPFQSTSLQACPFCSMAGQTLTQAIDESDVAFVAELRESKPLAAAAPGAPDGETKAKLIAVLKSHPAIQGKTEIVLPRYIPAAENDAVTFTVYAIVADGAVDPYRASPVDSKDYVTYIKGAVEKRNRPATERLPFFFSYLDHTDAAVSNDAYAEFATAPYKDVHAARAEFNAERIIAWLENPRTEPYRIGLYGLLLGLCGRKSDRALIQAILEDPKRRPISGVDGLLGGLCVLDPEKGTDYVLGVLNNPENDFNYRYSALRTVKFLVSDLSDLVDKQRLFERVRPAIEIPDIADLVIDEFRRNKVWTPTDQVLALFTNPGFDVQVVKRAVVRYALKCPDEKSAAFVAKLRKEDPQFVADVEEILRFEEAQQVKLNTPTASP